MLIAHVKARSKLIIIFVPLCIRIKRDLHAPSSKFISGNYPTICSIYLESFWTTCHWEITEKMSIKKRISTLNFTIFTAVAIGICMCAVVTDAMPTPTPPPPTCHPSTTTPASPTDSEAKPLSQVYNGVPTLLKSMKELLLNGQVHPKPVVSKIS